MDKSSERNDDFLQEIRSKILKKIGGYNNKKTHERGHGRCFTITKNNQEKNRKEYNGNLYQSNYKGKSRYFLMQRDMPTYYFYPEQFAGYGDYTKVRKEVKQWLEEAKIHIEKRESEYYDKLMSLE